MKIVSVNCGLPREVVWHGRSVTTSIFKTPVHGSVALRTLNLDGDRQSDLSVHGGRDKAVYCYPVEHYDYWREKLTGFELPMGAFGENFTIEGADEDTVHIGDRYSIGSAEVVVTQPRLPCYKLAIRFASDQIVRQFLESGRTGFYLAVAREGQVSTGDEVIRRSRSSASVSVAVINRLYLAEQFDPDDLRDARRALSIDALPESWKVYLEDRMRRPDN